jgi:hypothetical protein
LVLDALEHPRDLSLTPYKQKRLAGEVPLTPRHRLLCEIMVFGTAHVRAQRLGLPLNVPLSLTDAARVVDIRQRNAKQVSALPAFRSLYSKMVSDMRSGETARSIATMIEVRDDAGDGSAATKGQRLKAAQALMGEGGMNINIDARRQEVNVTQVRAGYVFERPAHLDRLTIETPPLPTPPSPEPPRKTAYQTLVEKWGNHD